jgi:hypothetical protein
MLMNPADQPFVWTVFSEGQRVTDSNFWSLPDHGKIVCAIHALAFRLLVPHSLEHFVVEMAPAKKVAISRGPWPAGNRADAFQFHFDDGTPDALYLFVDAASFDGLPTEADDGRPGLSVLVYVGGVRGKPLEVLGLPATYRKRSGQREWR